MINPTDLRVGNNVMHPQWDKDIGEVFSITRLGRVEVIFNGGTLRTYGHDVIPIPISESNLLLLGFKKIKDCFNVKAFEIKLGVNHSTLSITLEDGAFCVYDTTENFNNGNYPCFDINLDYIHQVQNAVYMLSGKQITLLK